MCLDFEMVLMLFLFWIVMPLLLISGAVFATAKIINNKLK